MSNRTTTQLDRRGKRLERLNRAAATVLERMRKRCDLHLQFRWYGLDWRLSDGRPVDPAVAQIVTQNPAVVSVGDALFANTPAQTWRHRNQVR